MPDSKNPFYIADCLSTRGRNTSRLNDQNCTVWYDFRTGEVISVGPGRPKSGRTLETLQLKCDEVGVIPELYGTNEKPRVGSVINVVLEQARAYRASLESNTRK